MTNPVEWCERKRDEAPDGEVAYHYHQMAEVWKSMEGNTGKPQ